MTPPLLRRAAPLILTCTLALGGVQATAPTAPTPAVPASAAPASPEATPPVPVPVASPPAVSTPAAPVSAAPAAVVPAPAAPVAEPGANLRGLWIDAFGPGLKTRAQVAQTVADAQRMGVNTLFVQAIRRADCLCLKASVPTVTDPDLEKNFDPLRVITTLAHARGMRVIAWVSVTGVGNTAAPNTNPAHVLRQHGAQAGAASWVARRPDGTWQEGRDTWLDAGIPDAAAYMAEAVVSLVRNYPVDGVQLDRIRYPDGDVWGYDPKTLARYRAETGRAGTPATTDPQWAAWKREQVTNLVRRITLEVKALRPDAWVSAATITYQTAPRPGDLNAFARTRTYGDVLQDWPAWMQSGLIDLNVLMNYKRDTVAPQADWFDGWNAFALSVRDRPDGARTALAAGTAMYLNTPDITAAQARRAVQTGMGWVGYSYRTPTAGVYGQRESTAQGLKSVMNVLGAPGMPLERPLAWTDAPPTVRGLLGRVTGTATPGRRAVQAIQQGRVVAESVTDALGYYGFAALPAGKTEVRVSGQRWADTIPERGVVRLPDLLVRDTPVVPVLPVKR
ncbi:family 10 glycosylhydrolase [Deinococcus aquaticus]|uniref:Family 10 glycosylhydrolase n=1 Tax=Deinococcus aquaticus TaxID=328692 RepID=A0ABY7V2C8_9DEIO|nr:family 10 glycosylhydrolase [Deinococcus aquaticus]WDA59342.1 family 10 glycosylhydrolase [Deinococcus aquaticus]